MECDRDIDCYGTIDKSASEVCYKLHGWQAVAKISFYICLMYEGNMGISFHVF